MEIKLISCPLCLKPHFDGVDSLRSTLIEVATSPITCPVCNENFIGLDKLTIHLFSHISPFVSTNINQSINVFESAQTKPDVVPQEGSNNNNNAIVQKEEINGLPNELRCDICNLSFTDVNILNMHNKLLHHFLNKNDDYPYRCHLCTKKFKMRGSLMVHLRVAHYRYVYDEEYSRAAKDCSESMETSEDRQIFYDGNRDAKISGQEKIINGGGKQWACDVCSKMFTTKYFLKKHKRLHTGEMPYFCAQCNKYFTFQQSYHKHMLYHTTEKPHVCGECGRAFKELSTLHNHERIHSGERPFACETCGKCFRQRVSYLVHKRIHTGVMPYKCTGCEKTFRYKVSQRSHKCTAIPPGDVIKGGIPEIITSEQNIEIPLANSNNECLNRLVYNAQGEIVTQTFAFDGENLISIGPRAGLESNDSSETITQITTRDVQSMYERKDTEHSDYFDMSLPCGLPDLQSLCLTNSPIDNNSQRQETTTLETINEDCFKELLYGIDRNV